MSLLRHDLLWLERKGWDILQDRYVEHDEILNQWKTNDFPVVVRRFEIPMPTDRVAIGIAMPLFFGKKRLALSIETQYIKHKSKPLDLIRVIPCAPKVWKEKLNRMLNEKMDVRVYGSLAWQTLTRLDYVQSHSDIDLLINISCYDQIAKTIKLLNDYSCFLPLDGEFMFPSGNSVSWKEMRDQKEEVLVKSINSVNIVKRELLV